MPLLPSLPSNWVLGIGYFMLAILAGILLELIYYLTLNRGDVVIVIGCMSACYSLFCMHLSLKIKFRNLPLSYCSIFLLFSALCFAVYTLICIADVQLIGSANILPIRLSFGLGIPIFILYFLMAAFLFLAYWIHRKYFHKAI